MSAVLHDGDVPRGVSAAMTTKAPAVDEAARSIQADLPPITGSSAVQRLEASRLKLKVAMAPPPKRAHVPGAFSAGQFLKDLPQLPGIGFLVEAVTSWWQHHPLRPVATIATEVTNVAARPMANRSPLAMVGVAALVGAALAWTRPWRWLLRSALLAGFVPQLAARVVAKLPIESWLTMLSNTLQSSSRGTTSGTRSTPAKVEAPVSLVPDRT